MPGTKSIVWNDANEAKMLRALIHFGNLTIPANVANQIAAYMGKIREFPFPQHSHQIPLSNMRLPGGNVPGKAITSHVTIVKTKLRKDLGTIGTGTVAVTATASTAAGPSGSKKRQASATAAATPSKKKAKKSDSSGEESDEEDEQEAQNSDGDESGGEHKATIKAEETTPPPAGPSSATGKGKAPASRRTIPRGKLSKVDYSKLHDPFTTMEGAKDSGGENVFGEDEGDTSEDTYASDKGFDGGEDDMEVG